MDRLKGKICVVTGVSEPEAIGYGIGKVFAKEGATVVCVVRRRIVFDRVKELTDAGYLAIGIVADLTNTDEVRKEIDRVLHGQRNPRLAHEYYGTKLPHHDVEKQFYPSIKP